MNTTWLAKILSGTATRGLMWAIAGVCVYLRAKGITAETPAESSIQPVVESVLIFVLPILASLWSLRKDKTLLATEPPK
jgi:hypothetical protein